MQFTVKTLFNSVSIEVVVMTKAPVKVRIIAYDNEDPERVFTNRWGTVNGTRTFNILIPDTPGAVNVLIYNEAIGERAQSQETTFEVLSVRANELKSQLDLKDIGDPAIREFVEFIQSFAWHCGSLPPGKTYASKNDKFFIELVDVIMSQNKEPLPTPARISRYTGRIQVAKKALCNFTVPMRIAILLHEFSHYFLNVRIQDESEADLNGLLIYLALGYPTIEGYQAFLETFKNYPSQENGERFKKIEDFIKDYEKTCGIYE